MQIKTIMRYHLTSARITIIHKTRNNKCWKDCTQLGGEAAVCKNDAMPSELICATLTNRILLLKSKGLQKGVLHHQPLEELWINTK